MSRGTEPGDGAALALEVRRGLDLRPTNEINRVGIGGSADQSNVTAFDARRNHGLGPGAGKLHGAAHNHSRDQRAAADVNGFDVETIFGEKAAIFADENRKMLQ